MKITPNAVAGAAAQGATLDDLARLLGVRRGSNALRELVNAMCTAGYLRRTDTGLRGPNGTAVYEFSPGPLAHQLDRMPPPAATTTGATTTGTPVPAGAAKAAAQQYPHPPAGVTPGGDVPVCVKHGPMVSAPETVFGWRCPADPNCRADYDCPRHLFDDPPYGDPNQPVRMRRRPTPDGAPTAGDARTYARCPKCGHVTGPSFGWPTGCGQCAAAGDTLVPTDRQYADKRQRYLDEIDREVADGGLDPRNAEYLRKINQAPEDLDEALAELDRRNWRTGAPGTPLGGADPDWPGGADTEPAGAPAGRPAVVRPPVRPDDTAATGGADPAGAGGAPSGAAAGGSGGAPPADPPVVRNSDEAYRADTGPVEQAVLDAYDRARQDPNRRDPGDIVMLDDLRAALPPGLPRELVDAALLKLGSHPDVSTFPAGRDVTDAEHAAGVHMGGGVDHAILVHPELTGGNGAMLDVKARIPSADRATALSVLSRLTDDNVRAVAEHMDVPHAGVPAAELRERVADRAQVNHDAWSADAQQQQDDGTLLYRADNDPEWAAGLDDAGRGELRAAAARLHERIEAGDPSWQYARARVNRWR